MAPQRVAVILEAGTTKVFATAADWPGWTRAGRTPEAALIALADYAERYAEVVKLAGQVPPTGDRLTVVETLVGDAATNFGAPGKVAEFDRKRLTDKEAQRRAALVDAAWQFLDLVSKASPSELRKGPRGGGRDRDKMLDHVLAAEVAYARAIGLKLKQPQVGDRAAIAAAREAIVAELRKGGADEHRWPRRYAAQRIAWHVLDHAWEMQDRRS